MPENICFQVVSAVRAGVSCAAHTWGLSWGTFSLGNEHFHLCPALCPDGADPESAASCAVMG